MYKKFDLLKNSLPLNIQLFAEDVGGSGTGDDDPQEKTVSKELFDKQAKDIADLKRQLKAKQTEEELAQEEQREKDEELENLRDFKRRSTLENTLLSNGIAKDKVNKIADAILKGDMSEIGTAIATMYVEGVESYKNQIEEYQLSQIEQPQGGSNGSKEVTLEDYKKMNIDERIALKNSNPELFEKLRKRA